MWHEQQGLFIRPFCHGNISMKNTTGNGQLIQMRLCLQIYKCQKLSRIHKFSGEATMSAISKLFIPLF